MRVFVTGASGYIGHAVARAFRQSGHDVYGLIRSKPSEHLLRISEIKPIVGDMNKPKSYMKILDEVEVIVHCAYEMSAHGVDLDASTIDTLVKAASKANLPRTVIYTSGVWVYGNTGKKVADEASTLNPIDYVKWRPRHEKSVLDAHSAQVRTVVIRPGCVYGGVNGLTAMWFDSTRQGAVEMVGEGNNRWSMIHVEDLARLYVLAAERELSNVVLNATDSTSLTVKEMVEAIAEAAGIPGKINQLTKKEAMQKYGALTDGLLIDQKISSERAARLLGWHPKHTKFIDAVQCDYDAWKASQR